MRLHHRDVTLLQRQLAVMTIVLVNVVVKGFCCAGFGVS